MISGLKTCARSNLFDVLIVKHFQAEMELGSKLLISDFTQRAGIWPVIERSNT